MGVYNVFYSSVKPTPLIKICASGFKNQHGDPNKANLKASKRVDCQFKAMDDVTVGSPKVVPCSSPSEVIIITFCFQEL